MQEIWKKLCLESGIQSSELIPPLPPRLLTDDDLKPFYEAMKIPDKPVVAPSSGLKRKGQSLGGLDIQHYGRGKRAREVGYTSEDCRNLQLFFFFIAYNICKIICYPLVCSF